jgi:hypothetical protein
MKGAVQTSTRTTSSTPSTVDSPEQHNFQIWNQFVKGQGPHMNSTRPYNRTLLQADKFDLVEFVKLTRDLPFKKLNPVLNDHLNEVKKELGQIVNDEFNQFIQLYAGIGESGAQEIAAVEKKLIELDSKLAETSVDVNGDYEDVTEVLEQIMNARKSEVIDV